MDNINYVGPPMHEREEERLQVVNNLGILDTEPEPEFDSLTKEAIEKLHVPISTISIIDKDREWFKSCQGIDLKEGPRNISFCGYAMLAKNMFIVEDTTLDDRFKNNPYVTGYPFIRFYAGMAIIDSVSKLPVGVFCVKDTKPRTFSMDDLAIFMDIAGKVEQLINQYKK